MSSAGSCPACGRFQRGHFLFRGALLAVFAIGLGAVLFLGSDLAAGLGNVIHDAAEHDARLHHRLQQENEEKPKSVSETEDDGEEALDPPPAGEDDAEVETTTADSG